MPRRLTRSLSFRVLAIFVILGGLFVFGTYKAVQNFYNSAEVRGLISGHLSLHVNYVREDIGTPPRIDRAISITRRVPVDIRILGPSIDWASDPDFPALSELEFAPSPIFSDVPGAWVDELQGVDFANLRSHNFLRMRQGGYDIVVSTPRIADKPDGPPLVLSVIAMGLTFLIIGYFSVQWLIRPIRTIRAGAAAIGRGNFEHRIENIRRDQLGDLAVDINTMASDVERLLDAKRALLLGISHELRTPLSRMRLTLEFVDDKDSVDSLKAEIMEMEKIVASLLEAERLNSRHSNLMRTEVIIGDLVAELIDDFFSRDGQRIELDLGPTPIMAYVDVARISLLLKNLLSNALRYSSPEDGPIKLSARLEADNLILMVSDQGPGISKDQAQHIGEPFYRSDPSRTRDSGGTGLGLYLARLVAEAHDGKLRLIETDRGAKFEARIPTTPA